MGRNIKLFVTAGLLILSLLIIGNGMSQESGITAKAPDTEIAGESAVYTLGKGDIVEILVRNQPEFSGIFAIGPDGNIQYNFVGDIKAEGMNKFELRDSIADNLDRYVKNPDVSVTIAQYLSKFVYILGEVGRPGKYPMKGDTVSLREAIVTAGLPTRDAALRRVYVIEPDEAKPASKKIDLFLILYKGILKDDLTLNPGDLVVVPSTVPSEINRALTNLLSPVSRAATVEALISRAN
ncbi:MAG: polysaccharide biosynthesis/export family protein [Candidatus Omnitrophota bacterium]